MILKYVVSIQLDDRCPTENNTVVDTVFDNLEEAQDYFDKSAGVILLEEPRASSVALISWEEGKLFPTARTLHDEAKFIDKKFTNTLYL